MFERLHRRHEEESGAEIDGNSIDELATASLRRLANSYEKRREIANGGGYNNGEDVENEAEEDDGDWNEDEDYEDGEDYDEDYNDYDESYDYDDEDEPFYATQWEDMREENLRYDIVELPREILEKYTFLSELPDGVAVMGGTARSIAREMIAGDFEPIRDIDLVNMVDEDGTSAVSQEELDELSRKYMPDDYRYGHGIGNDTVDNYFMTRDFTVNQCLIMGNKLVLSELAYNDLQENIIRPSFYELNAMALNGWSYVSSRLFARALVMQATLKECTSSIPTIEDMNPGFESHAFQYAVAMNKAMMRGVHVAQNYTNELIERDLLNEDFRDRPKAAAIALGADCYDFSYWPMEDERREAELAAEAAMEKYHAEDRAVRSAMKEYENSRSFDSADTKWLNLYEPLTGEYTEHDYDEINREVERLRSSID